MVELVKVEGMQARRGTVEYAPKLVFDEVVGGRFRVALVDFVMQGFEWKLYQQVQFVKDGANLFFRLAGNLN